MRRKTVIDGGEPGVIQKHDVFNDVVVVDVLDDVVFVDVVVVIIDVVV